MTALAAQQVARSPGRMTLGAVSRSRKKIEDIPERLFLCGVEGVGKTSFAADSESPIFIAAENGVQHIDVPVFPEPQTFSDVLDALQTLTVEKHSYRNVVIDTVDWVEPLLWAELCAENKWATIESPGYGKGYNLTGDKWRKLIIALTKLQDATGMGVILLAHSAIKNFSNPSGDDFSRYEAKLHRIGAAIIKEWTHANLFAVHEEYGAKAAGELKTKGVSTGRRVIYTQRTAAWDAKNRYGLPPELPLSWSEYVAARTAGAVADPTEMATEARALVARLAPPEDKRGVMLQSINAAGNNPVELARICDKLRTLVTKKESN